ncbi:MAG: type II toxin-antitoxin system Phd/YefM family antitoxin [Geminicoccaceae bacterium]
MKSVTAREANQSFSRILSEAEAGEEIVITRHGKPVATLRAYRESQHDVDRQAALEHAIRLMENAPALGTARRFTRDEMHEP